MYRLIGQSNQHKTVQYSNTAQQHGAEMPLWSHQAIPGAHTRARARKTTNIIHKNIAGFFGGVNFL